MAAFCTLHIRSNKQGSLPEGFVRDSGTIALIFVDQASPEVSKRRSRVRRKLGFDDVALPRYHWRLSSDAAVNSENVYDHLEWIFSQVRAEPSLEQSLGDDFEYWLSFFWEGNGTGGGPLITLPTSDLLALHRVEMGIAFYLEP